MPQKPNELHSFLRPQKHAARNPWPPTASKIGSKNGNPAPSLLPDSTVRPSAKPSYCYEYEYSITTKELEKNGNKGNIQ
jgi:hypothetical protein